MARTIVALALLASATALSPREQMVEQVNNAGTTWTAAVDPKFADKPLGSSKHLYGVKEGSLEAFKRLIAEGAEGFELAPIVMDEEVLKSIPDEFDSETNWPKCAKVIGDIRDQSNCGCCWAFGGASAASDRACIASDGEIAVPFSAQDVCFNSNTNGCGGGSVYTPWSYIKSTGVVTGGQNLNDTASTPSDPFDGEGFCSSFSLPHCHHHGPTGEDPYPAEGDPGCPSERSPTGPTACDDSAQDPHNDFESDKYTFDGSVTLFPSSEATLQKAIMTDGPIEVAFSVYSDFENYAGGIYQHVTGSYEGGHAVRMVGWGVEDGVKYWKIANSWNPYWGENGYFRILRGSDECGIESSGAASSTGATYGKKSTIA